MDSGVRKVAWSKCDLLHTKQHSCKSAVYSFLDSLNQDRFPFYSLTFINIDTHTHAHTFLLWCILVSGVPCFSTQGREESGLGSKLTINNTLPEQRTRINTSTPFLLLLLPIYILHFSPCVYTIFFLMHVPILSVFFLTFFFPSSS